MTDHAYQLISADSHVNAPADMWATYLPAEFRDQAPRVEHTDEGDFEVFEGKRKPMMSMSAMAGRRPQEYTATVRRFSDVRAVKRTTIRTPSTSNCRMLAIQMHSAIRTSVSTANSRQPSNQF